MSVASAALGRVASRARRWPFARASARGRLLGRVVHRLDRRRRQIALKNLRAAFPERSESWRRRIARGAFEQMGRTAVEMLWSPSLTRESLPEVMETEGLERLREAHREGHGVLLATAHFGNWELLGVALGLLGLPIVSIARPLDDPRLERLLLDLRTRTGNAILPKAQAVRGALRTLTEGNRLVVLVDQNTQRHEAVFVPYFHDLASAPPILGHLHLRTGAPVLTAFAIPEDDRYRLLIEEPVQPSTTQRRDAVCEITAQVTARIEAQVRRRPAAWLWMHDRWRERPR